MQSGSPKNIPPRLERRGEVFSTEHGSPFPVLGRWFPNIPGEEHSRKDKQKEIHGKRSD